MRYRVFVYYFDSNLYRWKTLPAVPKSSTLPLQTYGLPNSLWGLVFGHPKTPSAFRDSKPTPILTSYRRILLISILLTDGMMTTLRDFATFWEKPAIDDAFFSTNLEKCGTWETWNLKSFRIQPMSWYSSWRFLVWLSKSWSYTNVFSTTPTCTSSSENAKIGSHQESDVAGRCWEVNME